MDELAVVAGDSEAKKPINPAEVKLEGDGIPAELQGKTLAEALSLTQKLSESLKLSEEARQQAMMMAQVAAKTPSAPAKAEPPPEPEVTDEQLAEMMQENPVAAVKLMQERAIKQAVAHYDQRLEPLFRGNVSSALEAAKAKYADEFELFGEEIQQTIDNLPDPSAMANPRAYTDLVAYVRGKDGNFDKLVAHRISKTQKVDAEAARAAQAAGAGFNVKPGVSLPSSVSGGGQLDDTQKEIARNLNMSEEDYLKWSKV